MTSPRDLAQEILKRLNPDDVVEAIRPVCTEELLTRFGRLADKDVHEKTCAEDLQTIADVESERRLTNLLPKLLPDSVVLGEEAVAADPAVLSLLTSDKFVWIVDPLDGTWYFRHGQSGFTMLIALTHKGIPLMSFVVRPNLDKPTEPEAQDVFVSIKGMGARLNGTKGQIIRVARPPALEQDLKTVWITRPEGQTTGRPVKDEDLPPLIGTCRSSRAIGIDFIDMVAGKGTHIIGYNRCFITPWDIAAPHLLLLESGATWLQSTPIYRASLDEPLRIVTASSEPLASKAWAILHPNTPSPFVIG